MSLHNLSFEGDIPTHMLKVHIDWISFSLHNHISVFHIDVRKKNLDFFFKQKKKILPYLFLSIHIFQSIHFLGNILILNRSTNSVLSQSGSKPPFYYNTADKIASGLDPRIYILTVT